jgi:hypothetical protein
MHVDHAKVYASFILGGFGIKHSNLTLLLLASWDLLIIIWPLEAF